MTSFRYVVYDSHGTRLQGAIDAPNKQEAQALLSKQKYTVVELKAEIQSAQIKLFNSGSGKVSLQSLEFITSELAILLRSGVRLDKGLDILKKGASSPAETVLLDKLASSVKAGKNIAEAFGEFPEIFDALYVNMLKLGDASGTLPEVFERLAKDLKFRRDLRSKIIQSLTYPMVILVVCVMCILFVFNYIVPQMSSIFDQAAELPAYTELLLGLSNWFINYQLYLFAAIVASAVLFMQALKQPEFKVRAHRIGLRLPLVGKAILLIERIRFNSSMSMMLSSGVSLVDSLRLSAGSIKNQEIKQYVDNAGSKVKQGGTLSDALKVTPLFTEFNISLIEVGEESGDLPPVFEEVADRSRQDFEGWTNTLTSMIEPILIMVMGGIVGSVVVVMLMSVVSTNDIGL